ncbi:MAG: hypothetical protein WCA77_09570 [Thermoplasmata archaeon]
MAPPRARPRPTSSSTVWPVGARIHPRSIEEISRQRWFAGKARTVLRVEVKDRLPMPGRNGPWFDLLLEVTIEGGRPSWYSVPVIRSSGNAAIEGSSGLHIASESPPDEGIEVATVPGFASVVVDGILHERTYRGLGGKLEGQRFAARPDAVAGTPSETIRPLGVEQSHTSLRIGERWVLKLFRELTLGTNPDVEVPLHLARHTKFRAFPQPVGCLTYRPSLGAETTVASLMEFEPNRGDAWTYFTSHLGTLGNGHSPAAQARLTRAIHAIGCVTADLHVALADPAPGSRAFQPRTVSRADTQGWERDWRSEARLTLAELDARSQGLEDPLRAWALRVLRGRTTLLSFASIVRTAATEPLYQTRIHGDLHLGQILVGRRGFLILDFEGEPDRPADERRARQLPLIDLGGILRSLDYVAHAPRITDSTLPSDQRRSAADAWSEAAGQAFLRAYLARVRATRLPISWIPRDPGSWRSLLDFFVVKKLLYELRYELGHRPDWLSVPLRALAQWVDSRAAANAGE